MYALRGITGTVTLDAVTKTWGRSGIKLTRELRKLITDPDLDAGRRHELSDICDRYDALCPVRNDLIHWFRPGRDTERLEVVRSVKDTRANPITTTSQMFERQRLGLAELVDLYYDLDDLTHDARNLCLRGIGIID